MFAPILASKLYTPPLRPGVITRPNLIKRLNEGLHRKLTLISAPAGFGKTTLVSEWVARCKRPEAWLSLDGGDNDPAYFLAYLVTALQKVMPKIGKGVLNVLQSAQTPPIESILTTLLNEISAIRGNFILVLDDYHVLDAKPVDDALNFLVEHLPPQIHLVIATREDPPLPLARLRAKGQITELRATDLRFSPSEATGFLNKAMGLNLSTKDIVALEARTEGWITGLQLAALSLQGHQDTASFIKSFTGSHRFVLDYLVEEVLQHQSEQIRSFLLQTAILDRLSSSLCNTVTVREDGKEMLEYLERSNLFLIPLDEQRQWYRYHHLFTDVLQMHLKEAQPDLVAILHRRASKWYEHNNLADNAIRHALAAEDFEGAAGLIELAWPTVEDGSLSAKWLGWVKALPDVIVRVRPVLSVWYAYALLVSGDIEAAETHLEDAELWLQPAVNMNGRLKNPAAEMVIVNEKQFRSLPATIAIARAFHSQALGDVPGTVTYAQRALDLTPEENLLGRGQATGLLGLAYWAKGDLEAAIRTFAAYTTILRKAGNTLDAISTASVLADIQMALGCLKEAVCNLQQFLQFVIDQGETIYPDTAELYRALGDIYLQQGNLEAAAYHLQRSQELGEKAELPIWRYHWYLAQARINETLGDLDGALALLNEAERLYIRTPLPDMRPIAALKARFWLRRGSTIEALVWARERSLSVDDNLSYLHEFEHITLARTLIAQYQNERVDESIHATMRFLDRLLQAAQDGRRKSSMIEILLLQALAHQAQGNITAALVPLERALILAEPESYVRIFLDEGKPIWELLTRLEAKDGTQSVKTFILKLHSAFDIQKKVCPSDSVLSSLPAEKTRFSIAVKKAVPQPLIEPLSEREAKVLRLLKTDLSGPEIARESRVSLSTVRTHTQNIYTKLGVNNRRAAIRRAEELDLL